MHFDRIELDALGPKTPAVVEIGSAPGPERGLQFPLRDRGLPEIEAHVLGIEDVLRAPAQVIAPRESKEKRAEEEEREETARARGWPKIARPAGRRASKVRSATTSRLTAALR